ncbi:MAG TPA: M64 family metallopeptidase [Thermoanaerobaculaceae bacterium]|nr:M64 family metallopeptidase [Thermoanaerobaculaceae bacterium]HRS16710.1 M64 family metallopeptidase [Thermoanaerobaculaceae bacterium]
MRRQLHAAALALVAATGLAQDRFATFDTYFVDRTLRVDYVHVGNASEEVFALDRLVEQGPWAGSRVHLVDPFDNGRCFAKVYDLASGKLLFSRGFDTYFGEYRTTVQGGKGVRRAYHESVLMPMPKAKVRFALELRGADRMPREAWSIEIDPDSWEIVREKSDPSVLVMPSHISGDPHSRLDVAILGEGYTVAEAGKFKADLERFTAILLGAEPYARARDHINVYGVLKPSDESGIDEPSHGSYRRTALGATFDSLGSERYVLTEDNRAVRAVAAKAPYDTLFIMVNSARYGGGGIYGLYATFTTDNQWHRYIFLHEFGHSFGGLADEYYTASTAYNEFYPPGVEPAEPNITALLDPAHVKWSDVLTPGVEIPTPWEKADYDAQDMEYQKRRQQLNERIAAARRSGAPPAEVAKLVAESERLSAEHARKMDAYLAGSRFVGVVGVFEGAGYSARGLYRPMLDCLMFSKGDKPLCKVCQAAVERRIAHFGE